eukprot:scaffold295821_cov42-Prasinocladus_malaysianus.AAC.1
MKPSHDSPVDEKLDQAGSILGFSNIGELVAPYLLCRAYSFNLLSALDSRIRRRSNAGGAGELPLVWISLRGSGADFFHWSVAEPTRSDIP